MKFKTLGSVLLAAILGGSFVGCSDSGQDTSTAFYLDSAVEGIDYLSSSGVRGQTRADGGFDFVAGDSVKLSLGNLVLRNMQAPQAGQKIIENQDAIITLLQSIDEDGDPTNGIQITPAVKAVVAEWLGDKTSLDENDFNATDGKLNNIADLEQKFADADINATSKTKTQAQEHVLTTINKELESGNTSQLGTQVVVGDKIHYVDYKNAVRTAAATAGAAEYHTGVGYGNTLFDSAENKCQNCHNELYDTWQDSMHGKSWNDPIFQSKFRDFLRIQLAKIGEIGSKGAGVLYEQASVDVGTKKMFENASQTCIKCHAPGAFYAGDVKVTVSEIAGAATTMDEDALKALKTEHESNGGLGAGEIAVIAANKNANAIYKATFQIGHKANKEGINCAFCHSIETPRLMGLDHDGNQYTLAQTMRSGPHGKVMASANDVLTYNKSARDADMNKFFRLIGPEKYHNNSSTDAHTPKDITGFDIDKLVDGRYTMASKDINGTDGKTHFTGGPFYGPYGVTGLSNENESDETNRSSNPDFHYGSSTSFNHFGDQGKALCLSCHQRSAGAAVPGGENGAGEFMELCSTWNAVTTGDDTNHNDSMTSPKCQKCHMEKIEGTVLHKWAKPDELFTDKSVLTPHFFPDNADGVQDNPVADKWLNSHAFLGGNKIVADKAAVVRKIKSGFDADVSSSINGDTLTVTTTFKNKTAHMLPGAHPMRRMLTRAIVTDSEGNMLTPTTMTGVSTFGNITNTLATLTGKTIKFDDEKTVSVMDAGNAALDFPGKVPDLNGSAVSSQRFYSDSGVGPVDWSAPDDTVKNQAVTDGQTTGKVFNAAIVDSNATQKFTRIYGHETGKRNADGLFVVRPGFDSNMVEIDTRLSPNETETYTLTYDITGKTGVSATYKVYYMQKGANGQFLEAADGFLDQTASDAKKHLVTEVFTKTVP